MTSGAVQCVQVHGDDARKSDQGMATVAGSQAVYEIGEI